MNWTLLLTGLLILVYGVLAVFAVRRPLLARIAVGEAVRRPWQSALVVAGLMVGAGAILSTLVEADSLDDSFAAAAYQSWGRVDITLTAGGAFFNREVADRLAQDPTVRGSVAGVQPAVELVGSVADLDRSRGRAVIRLIGFDPAYQAAFGAYVLSDGRRTDGRELAPGEVLISRSLADALEARIGDRLRLSVGQSRQSGAAEVTVAGIARPDGPGSYGLRPAVFAPPATVNHLIGTDQVNLVRISARGDGQSELDSARRAAPAVRAALRASPGGDALEVREAKAMEIASAFRQGEASGTRPFGLILSLFVVAAGLALVVNLALTLAEERRPRLAVLRALGMSRAGLVTVSMMEGALYSLAAAVVGCIPGVLVGWLLISGAARQPTPEKNGRDIDLVLSVRPGSVAVAVAAGALITLLVLLLAALRTSRMSISSSIRDLPEPAAGARRSWLRLTLTIGLAALSLPVLLLGGGLRRFLAGIGLIVLAAILTHHRLPDRTRATFTGAALTFWAIAAVATHSFTSVEGGYIFFSSIVTSVFGLSILAVAHLRVLEGAAGVLGKASHRLRATLRPPLAYVTRRPLRAGLGIGTFGLVLAILTTYAVLLGAYGRNQVVQAGQVSPPYDIRLFTAGSPTIALPASMRSKVIREYSIPTRAYLGPVQVSNGRGTPGVWHQELISLYEFSDEHLRDPPQRALASRDSRFPSDEAVWQKLREDPTVAIWTRFPSGIPVRLVGREGTVSLQIAAGSYTPGILDGIVGSRQAFAPFATSPPGTTLLLKFQPGADVSAVVRDLEGALANQGVEVATIKELVDASARSFQSFVSVPILFMRMGLLVGVLSLGILTLRAVVERRRAIGVLRALGYDRRDLLAGHLIEATLTASTGVVVGMAVGMTIGYLYLRVATPGVPFGMDAANAGTALALVYGAVFLATIGPALQASRLPPAQALRLSE